jgi:hypothetical protein
LDGSSPPPGSALRIRRPRGRPPLNGFLAGPKFAAVFQTAPFLGFLPSGCSPHSRSLTPLDAAWLPCGYPPVCRSARLESLSPAVSPTSALSRSCLVPLPAMSSLFTRRSTLPGHPGSRAVEPPVPPASPASKLRSLLRVRSRLDRVSPPQPADTLLVFCPSRALTFHASESRPARARGPNTRLRPEAPARDSEDRSPLCRVRPFLHHE